jgi:hypothetical protein
MYVGHNLFGSAETLCLNAMVGGTKSNLGETVTSFVVNIIKIAEVSGFMELILKKYIGLSKERIDHAAFEIEGDRRSILFACHFSVCHP